MAWRNTDDSTHCFIKLNGNQELATTQSQVKQIKNFDFDANTLFTEDINKSDSQKYQLRQQVYCRTHDAFATILKIIESEDQYECTLRQGKHELGEAKTVTVKSSELTTQLDVVVKFSTDEERVGFFTVDINDKIKDTLIELASAAFNLSGKVLFEGQEMTDDDDFVKQNVKMNSRFLILKSVGGGAKIVPLPWLRSPLGNRGGETSCSSTYSDALAFEAKVDLTVYGFMWNKQAHGTSFTIKFQYRVNSDGAPSDWYEMERTSEQANEEHICHYIDF